MDSNFVIAIVASICTAGSTAGVASCPFDFRFDSMEARFELLTGALHDIDKRLSIIEDRVGR